MATKTPATKTTTTAASKSSAISPKLVKSTSTGSGASPKAKDSSPALKPGAKGNTFCKSLNLWRKQLSLAVLDKR